MESFYTSLDYQDLLEVSGQDCEKFLQGQVTCDLAHFANDQYGLGALCNNKGRVYSSFRLLKHEDSFFMAMQPGLAEITQTTLNKYIPFYKAEIGDASTRYHRAGLYGPLAAEFLADHLQGLPDPGHGLTSGEHLVINLSSNLPRFEIWSSSADALAELLRNSNLPEQADSTAWQALDLEAGLFFIGVEDIEQYTPEEANLDLAGFVSFDKGCYTGQEIVARMHYRGKAGKRLYIVTIENCPDLGQKTLHDSSGKILGNITNLLYLNGNVKALTVLKTTLDNSTTLALDGLNDDRVITVSMPDYSSQVA